MAERELEVFEQGITVVIPVYNGEKYIQKCIQSVLNQIEEPKYVIIVDDGSRDGSIGEIRKAANDVPNTFLCTFFHKNRGANAARNFGMLGVKTEYSIILDVDAVYYPKMFKKMKEELDKDASISFVYSNYHRIYSGRPGDMLLSIPFSKEVLLDHNYISMCSMFRTTIFKPFDEHITALQDWDFWLDKVTSGHKGKWINEPLFEAIMPDTGITMGLQKDAKKYKEARDAVKSKYISG